MNTLNCIHAFPIKTMVFALRDGMAYDGCFYYFTVSDEKMIIKYDICFEHMECIKTERIYSFICYDSRENCFWAVPVKKLGQIYKLDRSMTEINCLKLGDQFDCEITGLAYECHSDSLLVSVNCYLYKVSKYNETSQRIFKLPATPITGVMSIYPGMMISYINDGQKIAIYNGQKRQCDIACAPKGYTIQNMVLDACASDPDDSEFTLHAFALDSDCNPYLLTIKICFCSLGFDPDCCNFEQMECCCDKCKPHPPCNGCNDLLESIALVETALSHILNAEGEKLQKVLAVTDDIQTILCVNKEVNQTIIHVTHLEQVLYQKVIAANECVFCKTP